MRSLISEARPACAWPPSRESRRDGISSGRCRLPPVPLRQPRRRTWRSRRRRNLRMRAQSNDGCPDVFGCPAAASELDDLVAHLCLQRFDGFESLSLGLHLLLFCRVPFCLAQPLQASPADAKTAATAWSEAHSAEQSGTRRAEELAGRARCRPTARQNQLPMTTPTRRFVRHLAMNGALAVFALVAAQSAWANDLKDFEQRLDSLTISGDDTPSQAVSAIDSLPLPRDADVSLIKRLLLVAKGVIAAVTDKRRKRVPMLSN